MNESHLDPDIHLWPECPDDCCYHCGKKFPADAEVEEDTPMWDGFCCEQCQKDSNRIERQIDEIRKLKRQLDTYRDGIFQLNNAAAEKPLSQDYIIGVTSMVIEKANDAMPA